MSRHRQQLRRDLNRLQQVRENAVQQKRRTVLAGQPFQAAPGEQLEVVASYNDVTVPLAWITMTKAGRYQIGSDRPRHDRKIGT